MLAAHNPLGNVSPTVIEVPASIRDGLGCKKRPASGLISHESRVGQCLGGGAKHARREGDQAARIYPCSMS